MPWAPKHPCNRCKRNLTSARFCPACKRADEQRRGNTTARGYGWSWQKLRLTVLKRDPICRDESGCYRVSTDVDHVVPKARGGSDDPSNLRGLCEFHNHQKAGRDDTPRG